MSKMGDVESEEEIRQEMEELGVSNDSDGGKPDVLMSGPMIQVTVIVLVLLLVAGSLLLVF